MLIALGGLIICLIAAIWLIAAFAYDSADHSTYDSPKTIVTGERAVESPEHKAESAKITAAMEKPPTGDRKELLQIMRKWLDERGELLTPTTTTVVAADAGGVPAEWVMASNANRDRRLLYIHGGAYMSGSPKSHRLIASRMSEAAGAAVLSLDYRLMPENPRMAGIEDCRTAYRWILENGPNGPSQPQALIVAGDSSGGNLALSTIAWARDAGVQAANAVVVLSPQTDATLSSPSLVANIETDIMQGKSFGPVVKAPKMISLWMSYFMNRINPSNPVVSPLLGDLSDLPPTLIQASQSEMFFDDAVRYANKANAQGSTVVLETWQSTMHVWHAFKVPEADDAFGSIAEFLTRYASQP